MTDTLMLLSIPTVLYQHNSIGKKKKKVQAENLMQVLG